MMLLDGLVIFSKSLSCLPVSVGNLDITFPLRLTRPPQSWIKGSTMRLKKIWSISLGKYQNLWVSIVIQETEGTFSETRKLVHCAIDLTTKQVQFSISITVTVNFFKSENLSLT